MLVVELATVEHVEQLLEISAARRQQYAEYQPQFWRPAPDAVDRQREYFLSMLHHEEAVVMVARDDTSVRGFAVARTVGPPPVYDPGGMSCMVDDFTVSQLQEWPLVGPPLLEALRTWGASRGATQIVVVTAQRDEAKRAVLGSEDVTPASEWWVGPISAG